MKYQKGRRRWFNYFIYFIVIALILPSIPVYASAETAPPFIPPAKSEQPPIVSDNLPTPEPKLKSKGVKTRSLVDSSPVELISERTKNEKVFDNGNGTFTKKIYQNPIHIKENNKWEEISTNLENTSSEVTISPKKTELNVLYEKKMKNGQYAQFKNGKHEIKYSLLEASGESKNINVNSVSAETKKNKVFYNQIFPNIDLRITNFNRSTKEDLILQKYAGYNIFRYELQTDLTPELKNDGSIIFYNQDKKEIFVLPKPFMVDSNINPKSGEPSRSEDVKYIIEKKSQGKYTLTLTANKEWLKDPQRVYPVYIDPTTMTEWRDWFENAFISDRYPNENYSGDKLWDYGIGYYSMKVGYYDGNTGTNWAYLKTDMSKFKGTTIQNAKLKVYVSHHSSRSPNGLWLDVVNGDWNASAITWYNKPDSFPNPDTPVVDVTKDQWAEFNITKTVQEWANNSWGSYGFKLHTNGNGSEYWKKIASAEDPDKPPVIEVTYSYPKPSKPQVSSYSNGIGSGSGYLNIQWNPVNGANGYKIAIFNGYDYEYIDVGNVTSWSTKDKKIWPTASEIATGRYQLHKDGLGSELAQDPSLVYRNAFLGGSPYGDYSAAHRYWIRVIATYPNGDSPFSDEVIPYIPLEQVQTPTGSAYANINPNTGYASMNWNPVPGATGYKVWIFNGKDYESFDVGNVTTWTTQNQNIWPTEAEISQRRYLLHHDKMGADLSIDPSPVYQNSGGVYPTNKNYWFRVTAYSTIGYPESEISGGFTPTFTKTSWLGMQKYWPSISVVGGQVNAFSGNFIMNDTDFAIDGRGPGITLNRTYNSQDKSVGLFGTGWFGSIEEYVTEESSGNILFTMEDKKTILFTKISDNKYQAPNGIDLEVKKTKDGFEIKNKDQSIRFFSTDGKIQSKKDAYGNTVKYTYNSTTKKIETITDASGRVFTFTYTGAFITKITGPDKREAVFEYNGDYLISFTTPGGKKYRYGYEGGKLRYKYDPKHTDANPYKTTYTYEGEKLVKVTDPLGKETSLLYNDPVREVTVTNPKGVKSIYAYTVSGNPLKTVIDADGLKLTTTFEYQANRLTKKTNPKDQGQRVSESYTYDGKGNATAATDNLGTEKYEYNKNNDITKIVDTEGKSTTVTYDGASAVSATTQASEASQAGMTSSVTKYDDKGNPIAESKALAMGTNLMRNAGFEDTINAGNLGTIQVADNGTVTQDMSVHAPGALGGKASLKVVSKAKDTSWGYIIGAQDVYVNPNQTYTLSGWLKADSLKNASAFFNIVLLDEKGNTIASPYRDNRYSKLTGTKDWTERQLTFRTTEDTRRVRIYMEVEHQNDATAGGTVWFDNMQLEAGVVSSSYNPVLNGSFENNLENWLLYTGTGTVDTTVAIDGGQSLKLVRNNTSDPDNVPKQSVILNQSQAQEVTVTGMSKAEGVSNIPNSAPNSGYAIITNVIYQDGTVLAYEAPFVGGTHDWQRAAITIPATKPIKQLDIHPVLRGQMKGTVWFDAIRVINGNKLAQKMYDGNGNYITALYDEENRKTSFTYDTYGNKLTEKDPKGSTNSYEYNLDNQLIKTTLANDTSVAYRYDTNGNVTEKLITADGKTQTVKCEYDVDNKLTVFQDALSRRISHAYDENANRISTKMPNGSLLEWAYDAANRVITTKRNGKNAFSYQYDANGNKTKVTDSVNGITRDKTYDVGNRITSMTDRGGSVAWAYYDKTHKLKETKITHGTYSNVTSYVYNPLNQSTEVVDSGQTYRFDYDEFGNIRTYTAGNGSGTSFQYDQTNKVSQATIGNKQGDVLLYEIYKYDANGNRINIERQEDVGKKTVSYEYDSINQLKKEVLTDGTIKEYSYDGFGNRTSVKVTSPSGKAITTTAQFNTGNQLTKFGSETLVYDENGNRTSDGKFTYTWNEVDQLVAITKTGESIPFATFKYDDDGRRIEKSINGQTIRYYYDGDSINVLYETDASGNVLRQYVYSVDGIRLAMKSQGKVLYYHYNPHGDVIAMTDADGKVVAQYEYDAWGNILKNTAQDLAADNPFGYAGYMYDKEIGTYYLMARYYHPIHGVFLSADPYPGESDDPLTQNAYTYARNNPVMYIDVDGHFAWIVKGIFERYTREIVSLALRIDRTLRSWSRPSVISDSIQSEATKGAAKGALGGAGIAFFYKNFQGYRTGGARRYDEAEVGIIGGMILGAHVGVSVGAVKGSAKYGIGRLYTKYVEPPKKKARTAYDGWMRKN
ncbi:DNRLRE domain-containing protein [Microbacteriaceae bacterium 4G12]